MTRDRYLKVWEYENSDEAESVQNREEKMLRRKNARHKAVIAVIAAERAGLYWGREEAATEGEGGRGVKDAVKEQAALEAGDQLDGPESNVEKSSRHSNGA